MPKNIKMLIKLRKTLSIEERYNIRYASAKNYSQKMCHCHFLANKSQHEKRSEIIIKWNCSCNGKRRSKKKTKIKKRRKSVMIKAAEKMKPNQMAILTLDQRNQHQWLIKPMTNSKTMIILSWFE